jgi:hypothetical protein
LSARNAASDEWDSQVGQTWPTQYIVAHWCESVDDASGIVDRYPRYVFIRADGRSIDTTSAHIGQDIALIRACRGDGPWDPPLPIRPMRVKTRRGYTMHRLDIARPLPAGNGPAAAAKGVTR